MENLIIESHFNKEDFIRISMIRWEVLWLKNIKQIRNYAIVSIVLLGLGFLISTANEPINPFIIFGIGSTVGSLYVIYLRIKSKKRYRYKIIETAIKFESEEMDCSYEFSDESVKYKDKEKELNFKWSVFTNYSLY